MLIKTKKNWKDFVEGPHHAPVTRREMLQKGMYTAAMSVVLPKMLLGDLVKEAKADTIACAPPALFPGAIAQIYAQGGPTMGARFISTAQASVMNANMAANYGISGGSNLMQLGGSSSNLVIDKMSPFGYTLLQGPPGYPGGAASWQSNVLSKLSAGGHLGPFNADDGAGQNSGLIGGVSPFKASQTGADIAIGIEDQVAAWANGLPSKSISRNGITAAKIASLYTLPGGTSSLTNANEFTNSASAAGQLGQAFSGLFGTAGRKDGAATLTAATCAFYGNATIANPAYGTNLFTAANISALSSKITVGSLSAQEQALLASYYQSAVGTVGGVMTEMTGRDYHGASAATIAAADMEEARAFVMFLAACDAAQAPGAMIYFANGQAIANGTAQTNITVNGTNMTINAPSAQGDAGGSYNAGMILFYHPKGSVPTARWTGTVNSTNGDATTDSNVGSSPNAVAGLYLSALAFVNNGSIPQSALTAMQSVGTASLSQNVMVF